MLNLVLWEKETISDRKVSQAQTIKFWTTKQLIEKFRLIQGKNFGFKDELRSRFECLYFRAFYCTGRFKRNYFEGLTSLDIWGPGWLTSIENFFGKNY